MDSYQVIDIIKTFLEAEMSGGERKYEGIGIVQDPYADIPTPGILMEAEATEPELSAKGLISRQTHGISITVFTAVKKNDSVSEYKPAVISLHRKLIESIHEMIKADHEHLKFKIGKWIHGEVMLGSLKAAAITTPLEVTTLWNE